jgi:phosphate transport system substrate-binding protein
VNFYLSNSFQLAQEVRYIPLPERAYELAQQRVDSGTTGSLFGGKGSQVGVRIEQLLEGEQSDAGK